MTNKYYRKDIFCSAYAKDGALFQFAIKLRNIPGALAEVARIFSSRGINILHGFHTAPPDREDAIWGFFVDLKGSEEDVDSLVKEVEELNVTLEVKLARPIDNGPIVDQLHFPIMVSGERSIIMNIKTVIETFNRLYERFGSGAGFILYEMGKAAGENEARSVSEKYDLDKPTVLKVILAERSAKGWGIPEIEKFDEEAIEASIVVHELFECTPFQGKNKEAKSQFFRGYLAGALSQLLNRRLTVVESECVAKGDRTCRFISKIY